VRPGPRGAPPGAASLDPAARRALARQRRLRRRRAGLTRLAVLLALLALGLGLAVSALTGGPAASRTTGGERRGNLGAAGGIDATAAEMPAVEAGLLPWRLATAVSREVVLPSRGGTSLVVVGGLLQDGSSSSAVVEVDPSTGSARQVGTLAAPVHDAAGVDLGNEGLVLGGGSSVPVATVEQLASLAGAGSGPANATRIGSLPGARADASAVVIGSTAYVVGGYSGQRADAAVLATSNGRTYRVVANLPDPVRYAAVAAFKGRIYVFGGDAASGPRAGAPVSAVQVVDPATRSAVVAGHLPQPLEGAAAAVLDGHLIVAGGSTLPASASPRQAPSVTGAIYDWSTGAHRALLAGHLFTPVSHAGVAVLGNRAWLVGGETAPNEETTAVQMFEPNPRFGVAGKPGAGSPYYGDTLLIADRGNNRLLALNDTGRIIWQYPGPGKPAPPGGFYFPDDAFFIRHGTAIISNQEENDTVVEIGYPSGKVLWQYGHPRQPGSLPGYLDNPDDAYLLKNGEITVADPMNCRVLIIDPATKKVLHQIGTPGTCEHQPPTYLGSPNGDTPLPDGDILVSEINGSWIDEFTLTGRLVWTVHLPIGYPSDPQYLGNGRYLVADYEKPGAFIEFDRNGHIFYRYGPASGTGELNMPSLVESLPSGVLMANDDHNDRMMAIDPATGALVWQYGHDGVPGTAPGYLYKPDGFDILGPGGTFPTHPATG